MIDEETLDAFDGDVKAALGARRKQAVDYLKETGSLPPWYEFGVAIGLAKGGTAKKFESPEEFLEKAMGYFRKCAENNVIPMPGALYAFMGFTSSGALTNYARRNPDFREAHQLIQTWLKIPLEWLLTEPGQNTTGAWKRLTNIPDGWEVDDDPNLVPMSYQYKDRRQQELVGLDGASLDIIPGDKTAEELYREMQAVGRRLAEEG
jgi:hypothetical protein